MSAAPLVRRRIILGTKAFADVVVWRVPDLVLPAGHPFKYRLAYVVAGECVIRYDNERGKGDHRHWGDTESPYAFSSPEQLLSDFAADISRWNDEHSRP